MGMIFSILFSAYFPRYWQGEFVWQYIQELFLVGDHFFYSPDPDDCSGGEIFKEKLDARYF